MKHSFEKDASGISSKANRKTFISTIALSLVLNLGLTQHTSAQTKQTEKQVNKQEQVVKGKEKKETINEWQEVYKLRNKLYQGKYGSEYRMALFDGNFIGPNHSTMYGVRSFTTARDHLNIGEHLLALFVNLGYTAGNSKPLPAGAVPGTYPVPLGCIWKYNISGKTRIVDSVLSTQLGKQVKLDDPKKITDKTLRIDSGQVVSQFSGLVKKIKNSDTKEWERDTLVIPQIFGTGSWRDANNFDLSYEWAQKIFYTYVDRYDISKRQFSVHTPQEVKEDILLLFGKGPDGKTNPNVKKPMGTIFTIGQYQYYRYLGAVYWRDKTIQEHMTLHDPEDSSLGQEINWREGMNPVWHFAFQDDKSSHIASADGLEKYILLNYGAGNYTMMTVMPKGMHPFSPLNSAVMYRPGCENRSYAISDCMKQITLNGRFLDLNFYEYTPGVKSVIPYNDDGVTDRAYKIYVRSEEHGGKSGEFWCYVYCGFHANTVNGRTGQALLKDVDSYSRKYPLSQYWFFEKYMNFDTYVQKNVPGFISMVNKYSHNIIGPDGKTVPIINFTFSSPDPNKKNKTIIEKKSITFNRDSSAVLQPEGLTFSRSIQKEKIEEEGSSTITYIETMMLDICGTSVPIENIGTYLKNHKLLASDIRKANKKYKKEKEAILLASKKEVKESTFLMFHNEEYDLENYDALVSVQNLVDHDLAQSKEDTTSLNKNIQIQEQLLESLEGATYDIQNKKLKDMQEKLTILEKRVARLQKDKNKCDKFAIAYYETKLIEANSSIDFVKAQIISGEEKKAVVSKQIIQSSPLLSQITSFKQYLSSLMSQDSLTRKDQISSLTQQVLRMDSRLGDIKNGTGLSPVSDSAGFNLMYHKTDKQVSDYLLDLLNDMETTISFWKTSLPGIQKDLENNKQLLEIKQKEYATRKAQLDEKKTMLKNLQSDDNTPDEE